MRLICKVIRNGMNVPERIISPDGTQFWNGDKWVVIGKEQQDVPERIISPDGTQVWNGDKWVVIGKEQQDVPLTITPDPKAVVDICNECKIMNDRKPSGFIESMKCISCFSKEQGMRTQDINICTQCKELNSKKLDNSLPDIKCFTCFNNSDTFAKSNSINVVYCPKCNNDNFISGNGYRKWKCSVCFLEVNLEPISLNNLKENSGYFSTIVAFYSNIGVKFSKIQFKVNSKQIFVASTVFLLLSTMILTMLISTDTLLVSFLNDYDEDGIANSFDEFPNEKTQWLDSDGDGYGDNKLGHKGDLFPEDPLQWNDTDSDGASDQKELLLGTDPYLTDSDGDGVFDGLELSIGTNPLMTDTDGDSFSDLHDKWPLENWVIELTFRGYENEENYVCNSKQMGWRISTSSTGQYSDADAYGYSGASDTFYLDIPDNVDSMSIDLVVQGWYSDCIGSNEEQMFWGFNSMRSQSDCGKGSDTAARFNFEASPSMMDFSSTVVGTRDAGSDWSDSGWLSSATITAKTTFVDFYLSN